MRSYRRKISASMASLSILDMVVLLAPCFRDTLRVAGGGGDERRRKKKRRGKERREERRGEERRGEENEGTF